MMQEYANGYDLSVLLKVRQKIKQDEARIILSQLVVGIKDVWDLGIIHRDMKLANILLHFPDKPELEALSRPQKKSFLASVDLTRVNFQVKISDFGLSTILDGTNTQLSICGTPLYSSPQLLKKRGYSAKVDTWALGVMLYEMMIGKTPFHSYEMKDLIAKINDGRYKVTLDEPLSIECALFLIQCLQMNENDRIPVEEIQLHPFINREYLEKPLTPINVPDFEKGQQMGKHFSGFSSQYTSSAQMANRFDDTTIESGDVILTTKMSDQKGLLIQQLVEAGTYTDQEIDDSEYFAKNYEKTEGGPKVVSLDLGPRASREQLEDSMNDSLRPNHFDGNENDDSVQKDENIDLADVDPDAFEFPKDKEDGEKSPNGQNGTAQLFTT